MPKHWSDGRDRVAGENWRVAADAREMRGAAVAAVVAQADAIISKPGLRMSAPPHAHWHVLDAPVFLGQGPRDTRCAHPWLPAGKCRSAAPRARSSSTARKPRSPILDGGWLILPASSLICPTVDNVLPILTPSSTVLSPPFPHRANATSIR